MNILKSFKMLLVGDTRVKTLVRAKDKARYDIKIVPIEGGQYCHVIKEIDKQLAEEYFSLIIIMTFQNDLTFLKNCSSKWAPLNDTNIFMRIKKDFNVDNIMEKIVDQNANWQKKYPDLHLVWVIPAVPDFVRYNERYRGKRLGHGYVLGILGSEQRLYKQHTKDLVEKFHENKLSYIDLNKLTRFRGKRLKEQRQCKENSHVMSWIDPVLTSDGVHPQTRMAERFFRMLSQLMKSIIKRRKECLKAELSARVQDTSPTFIGYQTVSQFPSLSSDSYLGTLSDPRFASEKSVATGLRDLRDEHIRVWKEYRTNPELHPAYKDAKARWLDDMRAQGVKFTRFWEIKSMWWEFWLKKLEALYQNDWKERKQHYLSRIPEHSSTFEHSSKFELCSMFEHSSLRICRSSSLSSISTESFDSDTEIKEETNSNPKKGKNNSRSSNSVNSRTNGKEEKKNLRRHRRRSSSLEYISTSSSDSDSEIRDGTNTKLNKRLKKMSKSSELDDSSTNTEKQKEHLEKHHKSRSPSLASVSVDSFASYSEVTENSDSKSVKKLKNDLVSPKIDSNTNGEEHKEQLPLSLSRTPSLSSLSDDSTDLNFEFREQEYSMSKNDLVGNKKLSSQDTNVLLVEGHNDQVNKTVLKDAKSETVKDVKSDGVAHRRARKPVTSKKANKLLDITLKLCQISDQFGALGISLSVLHVKALESIKNGLNPLECVDEDAKMLLDLISDKIKKMLEDSSLRRERPLLQEIDNKLTPFLESLERKDTGYEFGIGPYYGLEISSLIKATRRMHKTEIMKFLKTFLTYKGYLNVGEDVLNRIYLEIKQHEVTL